MDKETKYLLKSKKNRERLMQSIKEAKQGKTVEIKLDDK